MAYKTNNEDDYYYDMPFAFELKHFAQLKHIRLGSFETCVELLQVKRPSHYMVTFSRVSENGFNEKVTAIVTENNGVFKFCISADPIC